MSLREVFETFPRYGAGKARLRLLQGNNQAWLARWDLLDSARERIDISCFILKQDIFGAALLGHLLKKAEEGVHVRILLDAYGTKLSRRPQGNDYLDTLVRSGTVDVRMYRPLLNRVLDGLVKMSLRVAVASEHDKILVVDGLRAVTGGRNVAIEYFADPGDVKGVFEDLDVEVLDPGISAALTAAFEAQFLSNRAQVERREALSLESQRRELKLAYRAMTEWLGGASLSEKTVTELRELQPRWYEDLSRMHHLKGSLRQPLDPYLQAETRVLDSTTRYTAAKDTITRAATRLLRTTREEVFIVTPYVVVSREAIDVFAQASRRDVPITLFTNSPVSSKSIIAQAYFIGQWPLLLAGIPTLELYANAKPIMIHTKLGTFDGVLSLVGTYNLSPLSMATNSEVVLAVWSREFARQLTERPRKALAAGEPQVYRYRIARNADGSAVRDENGSPIKLFGPLNHVELETQPELQTVHEILRAAESLPGVSPLF